MEQREHFSAIEIDHRQMVMAIEATVDLVGMNDTSHGKQVGYIATQLAHLLKMDESQIEFLFELGLLHDCGVSSDQVHGQLVNHFDWEDAHIHCEIGYQLLKDFEPLAEYATPILYHHTAWDELQQQDLDPLMVRYANLIFLADRIDMMSAAHYGNDILIYRRQVLEGIQGFSGRYFDPELVAAFEQLQPSEAFWIALEDRHIIRFSWDMGRHSHKHPMSLQQLKQLARMLSYIVDQKSPFTAQHSTRVAILSRYLAEQMGLTEEQIDKIEVAGYLHDLGKLRTPDQILDKPGKLTERERAIMVQHSFETYEILRQIDGLDEIARWAAYHHEEMNGHGYPFHLDRKEIAVEARLIAVADVFQALVQDRPYRPGMSLEKVIEILDQFVEQQKLAPNIVEIAKQHAERCYVIARGEAEENVGNEVLVMVDALEAAGR